MALTTTNSSTVALVDTVRGIAFGPTFEDDARAEDFIGWAAEKGYGGEGNPVRLQTTSPERLMQLHTEWMAERTDEDGYLIEEAG